MSKKLKIKNTPYVFATSQVHNMLWGQTVDLNTFYLSLRKLQRESINTLLVVQDEILKWLRFHTGMYVFLF